MWPLLLMAAAGLVKATGDVITGYSEAGYYDDLANQNETLAAAAYTEATTSANNAYAINPDDDITSLAELHLSNLSASLDAGQKSALDNAKEASSEFRYSAGAAVEQAGLQEGSALQAGARSGVRMGTGSMSAGLVQAIKGINGSVTEMQRAQDASMGIAGAQAFRGWQEGQRSITEFTASANESYRSSMAAAELAKQKATLLTDQYRKQSSTSIASGWTTGIISLLTGGLSLGSKFL